MDYFSICDGIGAAHSALLPLGFRCVGVSEVDKFCNQLIDKKFGFKNYGDFTQWRDWGHIDAEVVLAGTPCQSFSALGNLQGTRAPTGRLTLEFVRFICRNAPRWFIWENVPRVLLADRKRLWRYMCSQFSDRGYSLAWQVLDSQYFGVPQHRRRIFLIGHLGSPTGAAKVLFDPETLPIFDAEEQTTAQADSRTAPLGHYTDGGKRSRMVTHTEQHYTRYRQNNSTVGTLTCQVDGGIEQITRLVMDGNRVRYLTPREYERLQGFPDDYTAGHSDTRRYKMLGNSMPVPVIRWLGQRILAVNREITSQSKAG